MGPFIQGILIMVVLFQTSCQSSENNSTVVARTNDTTRALSTLFNECFLEENMPGFGALGLGQQSIFGDTILFEVNDSLDRYIPQMLGKHYLKRISRDSICLLSKRYYNDTLRFPDFMRLFSFQKSDSGYQVRLQATCVMPDFNTKTRKIDSSLPCIFGMMCGGGIGVEIVKTGNSMQLKRTSGWSD
jgi:hypothetical protein